MISCEIDAAALAVGKEHKNNWSQELGKGGILRLGGIYHLRASLNPCHGV